MSESTPVFRGIIGSLRELAATGVSSVRERLELFSIELHEEKFRLIQILIWISAAVLAAVLAITFASLFLVFLFQGSARVAVLGGLAAFYAIALGVVVMSFKRYLARQPQPFGATIQELKHDAACIRPGS